MRTVIERYGMCVCVCIGAKTTGYGPQRCVYNVNQRRETSSNRARASVRRVPIEAREIKTASVNRMHERLLPRRLLRHPHRVPDARAHLRAALLAPACVAHRLALADNSRLERACVRERALVAPVQQAHDRARVGGVVSGVACKLERERPGPRHGGQAQAWRGEESARVDVGGLQRGGMDGVERRLCVRYTYASSASAHADAQDAQYALERHQRCDIRLGVHSVAPEPQRVRDAARSRPRDACVYSATNIRRT
jgi:hypothetical protein